MLHMHSLVTTTLGTALISQGKHVSSALAAELLGSAYNIQQRAN